MALTGQRPAVHRHARLFHPKYPAFRTVDLDRFVRRPACQTGNPHPGWPGQQGIGSRTRSAGCLYPPSRSVPSAPYIILLLDSIVFGPPLEAELKLLGVSLPESINPPAWQGFLASFYGGINEEVLLRLFVMTLIGAIGAALFKKMDQKLPAGIFWVANILAAVLFGLGHLPTTAAIGLPMDFLVVHAPLS